MNTEKMISGIKKELRSKVDKGYKKFNQERIAPHMTGFMGARIPDVKTAMKPYIKEYRALPIDTAFEVSWKLALTGVFELRIIAYELIYKRKKDYDKRHFDIVEKWVKNYLEDWNDCDNLCTHAVGALVSAYPGLAGRIVKWTEHKKFIVRRAAAVAFIFPVKRGEFHKTAFDIAGRLMYDENDIVRKGYGWMLKSLSESDREAVFKYVMRNKKIMPRTALRYAIEKLPREMRVKCIKKMEDKMKKTAVMCCLLCVFSFSGLYAEKASVINKEGSPYELSLNAEAGFVSVLSHSIKFGEDGTAFDYVKEGGQGVLFPFNRFTAELRLFDVHSLVFIYQPLEIVSVITAERPLQFYDTSFYEGDVMDVKYGFSFYRASYLWYFLKEGKNELGIGLSLQIRNASIYFKSAKGSYGMVTENVGPVPILKLAGKYHFENGFWAAVDADGFYASSEFFNGADYFFTGAIWDISSRIGIELDNGISPYLNLRWLGGGGEGTSQSEDAQGDGYTKNWLSTFSLTLGVDFK